MSTFEQKHSQQQQKSIETFYYLKIAVICTEKNNYVLIKNKLQY